MQQLNKRAAGLALGGLVALAHLAWLVLVVLGWAKPLLDFILMLHHISFSFEMLPFAIWPALGLLVCTFVVGYVFGWVFAALWNRLRN